ncbi:HNH endonuclease [Streptomyces sp. NPDC050504]|uniref:HNH endonuclease n=1 Tax=Streptomyces sp. NPDC050504 TaxID=3365618 RepID=UPI00378A71CA
MRRVWMVRGHNVKQSREPGAKGMDLVPEWVRDGFCSVSFREVPPIPGDADHAGITKLSQEAPTRKKYTGSGAVRAKSVRARQLVDFWLGIQIGDVVVVTESGRGITAGIVESLPYHVHGEALRSKARRRRVNWLAHGDSCIPRSALTDPTVDALKGRTTVYELKGTAAAELLRQLEDELADRDTDQNDDAVRRAERLVNVPLRNAAARKFILDRSGGECENPRCALPRLPDVTDAGLAILEVDHVVPLGEDGPDRLENMIALCPNCHALKTRGSERKKLTKKLAKRAAKLHARSFPGGSLS